MALTRTANLMSSVSRARRKPSSAGNAPARRNGRAELAAPRLTCTRHDTACDLTLGLGDRDLLSGRLDAALTVDGRVIAATQPWEQVCVIDEKQATYTEISQELGDGWSLERQLLVAHEDRFCFVADCVLGPAAAKVEYRLRWPLAAKIGFHPEATTHEGRLTLDRRRSLLVLPLSLPEWRVDAERCSLAALESPSPALEIAHSRVAHRLHAALFIDLDPARSRRPYTWRRLTIGEELATVSRDTAAGYRVQIGKEQWVFYRSLGQVGNRTVLGVNLCSDFLAAKFKADGTTTTLVEVE